MTDDYSRRWNAAMAETSQAGIRPSNAAPPLVRMVRKLGLRPRPPHYIGFWRLAWIHGLGFGVGWGLFMWVIQWSQQGMPVSGALLSSAIAGAAFGLFMAAFIRRSARRNALSRWEDL